MACHRARSSPLPTQPPGLTNHLNKFTGEQWSLHPPSRKDTPCPSGGPSLPPYLYAHRPRRRSLPRQAGRRPLGQLPDLGMGISGSAGHWPGLEGWDPKAWARPECLSHHLRFCHWCPKPQLVTSRLGSLVLANTQQLGPPAEDLAQQSAACRNGDHGEGGCAPSLQEGMGCKAEWGFWGGHRQDTPCDGGSCTPLPQSPP